ncbi:MAG: NAD(P)-dependent oxidoreductase [Opitutales bacterium]|jgi:nucleoside-diphosphate-sugar epimerase|nr:NAD(P)-dependent oxidoreductase [Opitutales bacterium]
MKTQKRIAVTGGSGMAGHWIIKHLVEEGYDVVNLDSQKPSIEQCRTIQTDLTQAGQVINALSPFNTRDRRPYDGVIHFGAIPNAHRFPNDEVFRVNTTSTYNVLEACGILGINKVVLASSESSYGFCFPSEFFPPNYLPVDENHPQLPEDTYGLSKVINEVTAEAFHRRTGMQVVSFRLGNILTPEAHATVKASFSNPEQRLCILWSYIDVRDVATACRLAIEKDGLGCQPMILAAEDTSSNLPSSELIAKYLPTVKDLRQSFDAREPLISSKRAQDALGWKQQHFLQ